MHTNNAALTKVKHFVINLRYLHGPRGLNDVAIAAPASAETYGWVAGKVPTSVRTDVLSFQHHLHERRA